MVYALGPVTCKKRPERESLETRDAMRRGGRGQMDSSAHGSYRAPANHDPKPHSVGTGQSGRTRGATGKALELNPGFAPKSRSFHISPSFTSKRSITLRLFKPPTTRLCLFATTLAIPIASLRIVYLGQVRSSEFTRQFIHRGRRIGYSECRYQFTSRD